MKTLKTRTKSAQPSRWSSISLLLMTVLIGLIGLLFIFEASTAEAYAMLGDQYHFVRQQAIWLGVGTIAMVITYLLPSGLWRKLSIIAYWVSIALLLAVFIPGIGLELNGAHRWIQLPGYVFQPVELMKFSLVIYFAEWLTKHQKMVPFMFLTFIPSALLLLQPDLGSALVVLGIAFGMYFIAGCDWRHLAVMGSIGVIALIGLIAVAPYRMERVKTFLDPTRDPLGSGFQIRQITLALGNGGVWGQGLGKSRQKFAYIPEATTDSIFSIIAEELGFVGSTMIIGILIMYLTLARSIVAQTPENTYQRMLAAGITTWFAVQIMLNLSAVVVLVPLTGVPLPFISYGGSALLTLMGAAGVLAATTRKS
jgi:cell division protein FtsW